MDVERYFVSNIGPIRHWVADSRLVKDSERLAIKPLTAFANITILFKNGRFYRR